MNLSSECDVSGRQASVVEISMLVTEAATWKLFEFCIIFVFSDVKYIDRFLFRR